MSGKFYLAAPYNTREESLHKVREIERLSGWTVMHVGSLV